MKQIPQTCVPQAYATNHELDGLENRVSHLCLVKNEVKVRIRFFWVSI
jgi:hypothetical protein